MNQNYKISKFSQLVKDFDIILINRKDDLMKHLSKNNKVIVLKKKAHRPNSDSNNDTQAPAWFKEFKKENDQRWEKQYEFNTQVPAWFKEFKKENDQRWEKQYEFNARQEKFNTQVLEFMKRQEQFNQFVIEQFKQHGWVK